MISSSCFLPRVLLGTGSFFISELKYHSFVFIISPVFMFVGVPLTLFGALDFPNRVSIKFLPSLELKYCKSVKVFVSVKDKLFVRFTALFLALLNFSCFHSLVICFLKSEVPKLSSYCLYCGSIFLVLSLSRALNCLCISASVSLIHFFFDSLFNPTLVSLIL